LAVTIYCTPATSAASIFAHSQADLLAVGVMPDTYVQKHKGYDRPMNSELSRVAALGAEEARTRSSLSFIAAELDVI